MKEKASVYDFARMCRAHVDACEKCPLWNEACTVSLMSGIVLDKVNEIILNWCKEHPIKTRQSEFLKLCPNAPKDENGIIAIPSCTVEEGYAIDNCSKKSCTQCRKEYWLAEVDENE